MTEMKPKCAVLMAVYNGMLYMEEQIQTILAQEDVDVTLFVSVDQSSDNSEAWLNERAEEDKRIVVLPHGRRFGGAGRNFFRLVREVDFSTHDYVAFADQDDHWYPQKLNRAVKVLKGSSYDGYSSNVTAFWPDGKQLLIDKAQPQKRWDFIFEAAGPGCTYVMSIQLMSAIKAAMINSWEALQDVSLHDWYCYAYARTKGFQWFIDSRPCLLYRQHQSNQMGVNTNFKSRLNRFKRIKQGWWFSQISLIAQLVESDTTLVRNWQTLGRLDMFRMAANASQCRRKFQDRVIFFIVCVIFGLCHSQPKGTPNAS